MKKILFATTALVATASVAAADVSFSGYGRFGAIYTSGGIGPDGVPGTADDTGTATNTSSRIRLQIDMTTEADNGLTFGARLRAQGNNGAAPAFNAARFWATSGGLTLGVGNIVGALEAMPGVYGFGASAGTGLSGLGFLDHLASPYGQFSYDAYSSGGIGAANRNGVEVIYSAGDFGAHLSYSKGVLTDIFGIVYPNASRVAANVSYTFNDWTVALGYQSSDVLLEDMILLTVGGKVGNVDLSLGYAQADGQGALPDATKISLRASTMVGAATQIYGYVTSADHIVNLNAAGIASSWATDDMSYGIGLGQDLGGGASLQTGIVQDYNGDTRADLGILFNF